MSHHLPIDDTKYAGPSKAIEILGRANAYGWIGWLVGAAAGGIAAAISTKTEGPGTKAATEFLSKVGIRVNGKWAVIAGTALVTSQALHYVGVAIGLRVGAMHAGTGQAQFERITARCGMLKEELAELKAERRRHQNEFHRNEEAGAEAAPVVSNVTHDGKGTGHSLDAEQVNNRSL